MKQVLLSLLAVLLPLMANAESITEQQALLKARQFMQGKTFSTAKSRRMAPKHGGEAAALYVFNADEGGYAIVSGDDRTTPILGYSDKGRLDMNDLPDHIQSWLDGYAEQIAYLQEHPEAQLARKTLNVPPIAPLLGETKWDQGAPYNDLCPMDGDRHSVTGCVATAMAQIMYYHKWPAKTTAEIPGYTTKERGLSVSSIPAGTAIDWGNMLPQYNGSETEAQKRAVAQLMLMCGTSVEMEYTSGESGAATTDVATALRNYFDYDYTTTLYPEYNTNRLNGISLFMTNWQRDARSSILAPQQ